MRLAEERYGSILEQLRCHEIPEAYPTTDHSPSLYGEQSLDEGSLMIRDEAIRMCGYCWLANSWIRPLAQWIGYRRCLEIMCGSGALSYALLACGVQLIATDNFSWRENAGCWYEHPWTDIQQMDCLEAIREYGSRTDFHALLEMRKANPAAQMLYIGEPVGGATALKALFKVAELVENEDFQATLQGFRSAHMLKDRPMLFR